MRRAYKLASLVAMGGALLQLGTCINWGTILPSILTAAGTQFLIDNGSLLDLFVD